MTMLKVFPLYHKIPSPFQQPIIDNDEHFFVTEEAKKAFVVRRSQPLQFWKMSPFVETMFRPTQKRFPVYC